MKKISIDRRMTAYLESRPYGVDRFVSAKARLVLEQKCDRIVGCERETFEKLW